MTKYKPGWECLPVIKQALNGPKEALDYTPDEYRSVFSELTQQTVAALPGPMLSKMQGIPEDIRMLWKTAVIQQVLQYERYLAVQNAVAEQLNARQIPFVILKGTSASCYYPHPELRAMGDIDIMTGRENVERACAALEEIGFVRHEYDHEFGRTIKLFRDGTEVEIHKYFTSLNDPEQAEYLDNLILDSIVPERTRLPDNVNGLVLLEHIGDHLEHGLGLRQIVDWMMYVKNCLNDTEWEDWFRARAKKIGLEKLAATVTKMCQIYLGLDQGISWCRHADDKDCCDLMEYIMNSGNFGVKESSDVRRRETVEALTNNRNPIQILRLLQRYGESNWEMCRKHAFLKPFAWIYQIGHSVRVRIKNKTSAGELLSQINTGKTRNRLFERLGVKQYSKGLAVLQGDHFEVEKPQ